MGHTMGPTLDNEAFDHPNLAIRGMNAITSVHRHLPQGKCVISDSLCRILGSGHGCQAQTVVRQRTCLLGSVGRVADASGHEPNFFGNWKVLESGQVALQRDSVSGVTNKIQGNETAQSLPVRRFDHDMGYVLRDGIDNHAPHLTALAITTARVVADLDGPVIAGRSSCISVLRLVIPRLARVLAGRPLVRHLHSVLSSNFRVAAPERINHVADIPTTGGAGTSIPVMPAQMNGLVRWRCLTGIAACRGQGIRVSTTLRAPVSSAREKTS